MTQLAGSLGTPYAFDPPAGCVLFFDEVAERPYRLDRLFTQLSLSGIIGARVGRWCSASCRAATSRAGSPRDARRSSRDLMRDFPGPGAVRPSLRPYLGGRR